MFKNILVIMLILFLKSWISPVIIQADDKVDEPKTIHAITQRSGKKNISKNDEGMSKPVNIEADRMLSNQRENVVVFTGNVVAIQGNLTINSEKMTVYHENKSQENNFEGGKGQQIDKIIATGDVKVSRDDLTATGEKVIFELSDENIIITGNAKVWHQDNMVQGEKVVFDMTEGTTTFESGGQEDKRVKAFFYPEEDSNSAESQ